MSGIPAFCRRRAAESFILISLLLLPSFTKCAVFPPEQVPEQISILSYNVCNLFDDSDNGTEYPEYDPSGEYWNSSCYLSKLESTGSAVRLAYPPDGPDIIALQEIENSRVLKDLTAGYLKGMGYKYYAAAEKDDSAITTGIISRYPLTDIKNHSIHIENNKNLRNIFECRIKTPAGEFLIFNNHWKSKLGGAEFTEDARIAAAGVVRARVSEILAGSPETDIIILGDLNENIDEYYRAEKIYATALFPESEAAEDDSGLIFVTGGKVRDSGTGGRAGAGACSGSGSGSSLGLSAGSGSGRLVLFSPWFEHLQDENNTSGSYYYKTGWETIDHFLLPFTLFDSKNFDYSHFRVIDDDELLDRYNKPLAWNRVTQKGYSDHLPVLLILKNCAQDNK